MLVRTERKRQLIDARYNKRNLIERIEHVAGYSDLIELTSMDAVELIKRYKQTPAEKMLVYLDPPYYVKGRDLYLNYYNDDDHRDIANAIKKYKVIISAKRYHRSA